MGTDGIRLICNTSHRSWQPSRIFPGTRPGKKVRDLQQEQGKMLQGQASSGFFRSSTGIQGKFSGKEKSKGITAQKSITRFLGCYNCGFSPLMSIWSDRNMRLGDVLLPPGIKQWCLYLRVQGLFTLRKVLLMQLSVALSLHFGWDSQLNTSEMF